MSAIRCAACGRFISYDDCESGAARSYYEPLSEFGPEVCEWECEECWRDAPTEE